MAASPERIELPVRWYPTVSPEDVPCREENLSYRESVWPIAPEQTALVLVDCWDTHPIETHLENSGKIIREVVAPARAVCREAGITVVHAPSPGQAQLYPEWLRYAGDAEFGYAPPQPAEGGPVWPPPEFRQRTGEYAVYSRPTYLRDVQPYVRERRIVEELEPVEGEYVVATAGQLHRLARHKGILHLLYAGFAANMCVLYRDYGIKAMHERGYSCVLLRDGTVAIEAAHTYPEKRLTEAACLAVEMLWGVSSTAAEVIAACRGGG